MCWCAIKKLFTQHLEHKFGKFAHWYWTEILHRIGCKYCTCRYCRWTTDAAQRPPVTTSSIPAVYFLPLCLRPTMSACPMWNSCSAASGRCSPSAYRTAGWWTYRCLGRCWSWCVAVTWVMRSLILAAAALYASRVAVTMILLPPNQWSLLQWTRGMNACLLPYLSLISAIILPCCQMIHI